MLIAHEYPLPPPALPDQPAGLRGGRAAAQLQRRRRRAVPHPVGDQPPDQGPRRRARRGRCSSAARATVQISPDGQTLLRAVEPWLAKLDAQRAADPPRAQPPPGQRHHLRLVRLALAAAADRGVPARASRHRHPRLGARRDRRPRRSRSSTSPCATSTRRRCPRARVHLFDETLTPVVSRGLWEQIQLGKAPPLAQPGRPGAAHPGRGRRRPAEHRVPELAPLARRAGPPRPAAAALALPQLHLPAGAGRAGRPRRGAGAGAAGVRGAAARRAGRAVRRGRAHRQPVLPTGCWSRRRAAVAPR